MLANVKKHPIIEIDEYLSKIARNHLSATIS